MLKRVNFYTALTFVVYPALFTAILMIFLFSYTGKKDADLLTEGETIEKVQDSQENSVPFEQSAVKDNSCCPDSSLNSINDLENCQHKINHK